MYYPSDDLDTPPQPRFLDDSTGGDAEGSMMMMMDPSVEDSATATTPINNTNNNNNATTTEEDEDEEEEDEDGGDDGTARLNTSTANSPHPLLIIPAVSNLDRLYGLREIGKEALCWQLSSAKPGNGVEQIRDHSTETYWQSDGTSQPHWIQVHFARRVAISHVCLYLDYNLDESYTPRRLSIQVGMTNQDLQPALLPPNTLVEFQEPVGWCIIPLKAAPDILEDGHNEDDHEDSDSDPDDGEEDDEDRNYKHHPPKRCVKAHLVQISILSQHQNGRDTHVRQVQLYGPRSNNAAALRKVHKQEMQTDTTITTSGGNDSNDKQEDENNAAAQSSRLWLQRGRHWDEDFSTVAMSQFSTVR